MEKHTEDSGFFGDILLLESDNVDISFVGGAPGRELLKCCSEVMLNASKSILSQDVDVSSVFMYGYPGGDKNFLHLLSQFLSEEYGDIVNCSDVMITAGATQGLHMLVSLLCQKSSPVFIEDPTYFFGFRMIRDDLQMNLVPVPSDHDGIDISILDQMLTSHKSFANPVQSGNRYWAAVYLIPVFSNPTGGTYSIERCKELVKLARKHDVLLITEDVYNLLYFMDPSHAPPRLISFDKKTDPDYGRGHVISNGTFSKILAPSLRLGWIEGSTNVISVLSQSNLSFGGGCFNYYTSNLVSSILNSGFLHNHTKLLREVYKKRMDMLCSGLDEHLPKSLSYQKPQGGFFLWLEFRPDVDASQFVQFATQNYNISFLPGIYCSPTGSFRNCARLSISINSEDLLYEGAKRLCTAYQEYINNLDRS